MYTYEVFSNRIERSGPGQTAKLGLTDAIDNEAESAADFLLRNENFLIIKQIHTFTSSILFEQLVLLLFKQCAAGERLDLLDNYDFPARTITETENFLFFMFTCTMVESGQHVLLVMVKGKKEKVSQTGIAAKTAFSHGPTV